MIIVAHYDHGYDRLSNASKF